MLCQEYRILIDIQNLSGMDSNFYKKHLDRINRIYRIFFIHSNFPEES
jgi:hypothetical protein